MKEGKKQKTEEKIKKKVREKKLVLYILLFSVPEGIELII